MIRRTHSDLPPAVAMDAETMLQHLGITIVPVPRMRNEAVLVREEGLLLLRDDVAKPRRTKLVSDAAEALLFAPSRSHPAQSTAQAPHR